MIGTPPVAGPGDVSPHLSPRTSFWCRYRKLRPREVKLLGQDHIPQKRCRQDLNSGLSDTELLTTTLFWEYSLGSWVPWDSHYLVRFLTVVPHFLLGIASSSHFCRKLPTSYFMIIDTCPVIRSLILLENETFVTSTVFPWRTVLETVRSGRRTS